MKYLLCSIALHFGLLMAWQWSCSAHEYGLAPAGHAAPPGRTVSVALLAPAAPQPPAPSRDAGLQAAPPAESPAQPAPEPPPASAAEAAPDLPEIMPAGSLTKLPRPASDVNLDVPELKRIHFAGRVELNLVIETDGTVSDVAATEESELTRVFTDLVAARFKAARFFPGEIDGRAVRSRLRITVVSEFVAPPQSAPERPAATGQASP